MDANTLAKYFKILADETRLNIISFLKNGTMCACNILEKLNITQPTLSYHMKILSKYAIVTFEKKGVWVHYTLNKKTFTALTKFFDFELKEDKICSCKNK